MRLCFKNQKDGRREQKRLMFLLYIVSTISVVMLLTDLLRRNNYIYTNLKKASFKKKRTSAWLPTIKLHLYVDLLPILVGLKMTTATRQEVLGLYRSIFRLARKWQAASGQMEDTIKEKQYILSEARTLFQKNKNVSRPPLEMAKSRDPSCGVCSFLSCLN